MNLRRLYKRLRYWKQIQQGFGLLEDLGQRVELDALLTLEVTGLSSEHPTPARTSSGRLSKETE